MWTQHGSKIEVFLDGIESHGDSLSSSVFLGPVSISKYQYESNQTDTTGTRSTINTKIAPQQNLFQHYEILEYIILYMYI